MNAIAFFALLYALELGHSTIVFPLVGMSLLVSIALSKMAFHERLGARRALAILIAVVAIVLIRANT